MVPEELNPPPRRQRRPKRLRARPLQLTEEQILAWADAFHQRRRRWPRKDDGPITETLNDTWCAVNHALNYGRRGLPGGSSLAQLLAEHRGKRNRSSLPRLTEKQILRWADEHHQRTGNWPTVRSGQVIGAAGETWSGLSRSLQRGRRGLRAGSSLARLLMVRRGVPNFRAQPRLTVSQILAWADAHHVRTGRWPTTTSGSIVGAEGETWARINWELTQGNRGLPARSSLPRLLAKHRGVRNRKALPPLRIKQILAWADAFRSRTGRWPNHLSGPVDGASGETWSAIHAALYQGQRGMPGGSSLFRLLAKYRGAKAYPRPRKLKDQQ